MLSGVMLIIVTMFAVLGAYYLSDLLTQGLFRHKRLQDAVVLVAAQTQEEVWSGVLDTRKKLPDAHVVVLCPPELQLQPLEPGMKGVLFATTETLSATVQELLAI